MPKCDRGMDSLLPQQVDAALVAPRTAAEADHLCGGEPPVVADWMQRALTGLDTGDEVRAASLETSNGARALYMKYRSYDRVYYFVEFMRWLGQPCAGIRRWFTSSWARGALATSGGWLLYLLDMQAERRPAPHRWAGRAHPARRGRLSSASAAA